MAFDNHSVIFGFVQSVAKVVHILTRLVDQLDRITFGIGNQTVGIGNHAAQTKAVDIKFVDQRGQRRRFRTSGGAFQFGVVFRFDDGFAVQIILFDRGNFFVYRINLLVQLVPLSLISFDLRPQLCRRRHIFGHLPAAFGKIAPRHFVQYGIVGGAAVVHQPDVAVRTFSLGVTGSGFRIGQTDLIVQFADLCRNLIQFGRQFFLGSKIRFERRFAGTVDFGDRRHLFFNQSARGGSAGTVLRYISGQPLQTALSRAFGGSVGPVVIDKLGNFQRNGSQIQIADIGFHIFIFAVDILIVKALLILPQRVRMSCLAVNRTVGILVFGQNFRRLGADLPGNQFHLAGCGGKFFFLARIGQRTGRIHRRRLFADALKAGKVAAVCFRAQIQSGKRVRVKSRGLVGIGNLIGGNRPSRKPGSAVIIRRIGRRRHRSVPDFFRLVVTAAEILNNALIRGGNRLRRLFMHLFKQFILAEDIAVRGQQADRIMRLERLVQRFLRIGNNPEIGQFLFAAGH